MKCPKCGLLNPNTALKCECGYSLGSSEINVRTIRSDTPAATERITPKAEELRSSWLCRPVFGIFRVGLLLVYLSFLVALVPAGISAAYWFGQGSILFGLWSVVSVIIVPKATLGIVLIAGRESNLWRSISFLLRSTFPRTFSRYKAEAFTVPPIFGGPRVWIAYLTQIVWLAIGLLPLALPFFA